MSGWIYLIRNGDLCKIGITKKFENRMRQLKPDNVIMKLYTSNYKQLEKELHKRYNEVRIPQTEYFRLDYNQIKEIKKRIRKLSYPNSISFGILIKSFLIILFLSLLVFLFLTLIINDREIVLFNSLLLMEKVSFGLSFLSLFVKSNKYLSSLNEIKFRSSRLCFYILFAYFFRLASIFYFG